MKIIITFIFTLTSIIITAQSNGDQLRKEGKLEKVIEAYKIDSSKKEVIQI